MPTNQILQFAGSGGANVLTPSAYAALPALANGFTPGVAISKQLNTVWRQSSFVSAMIAQFIADNSLQNVNDDGNLSNLEANFVAALANWGAVPGDSRNVKVLVTTASATATFTADAVVTATGLGLHPYFLANFNHTCNLGTTGVGGIDIGSAPISGYVGVYAIYNPTTGASGTLAVNATSSAAPTIYGGANMPSGYTASALISVWPTNGSGNFIIGNQINRQIFIAANQVFTTSTVAASFTSFSISPAVPKNAIACSGSVASSNNTVNSTTTSSISGSSSGIGASTYNTTTVVVNGGIVSGFPDTPIITSQTLYYQMTGSNVPTLTVFISSYKF